MVRHTAPHFQSADAGRSSTPERTGGEAGSLEPSPAVARAIAPQVMASERGAEQVAGAVGRVGCRGARGSTRCPWPGSAGRWRGSPQSRLGTCRVQKGAEGSVPPQGGVELLCPPLPLTNRTWGAQ